MCIEYDLTMDNVSIKTDMQETNWVCQKWFVLINYYSTQK